MTIPNSPAAEPLPAEAGSDPDVPTVTGSPLLSQHALAQQAAEHLAGWQRARADYENLERRMRTDIAAATESGGDACLRSLLPIVDHFIAARQQLPEDLQAHPWMEGFFQIHRALEAFLADAGVQRLTDTEVAFDPSCHEAVTERVDRTPRGTVIEVLAPGYRRHGRVLRPAKVVVSKGPPDVTGTQEVR